MLFAVLQISKNERQDTKIYIYMLLSKHKKKISVAQKREQNLNIKQTVEPQGQKAGLEPGKQGCCQAPPKGGLNAPPVTGTRAGLPTQQQWLILLIQASRIVAEIHYLLRASVHSRVPSGLYHMKCGELSLQKWSSLS